MEPIQIIKIGGHVLDDPQRLSVFLTHFAAVEGLKILVHGGGAVASQIGQRLGLEPHYVNGRRVTDAATLELVTMVYGGLLNKKLVAQLQHLGCNAVGLTGADGNLLHAVKRPVKGTDYGFVGDIRSEGVNASFLQSLFDQGLTPVLAPLTHDGAGSLLNTNADTIAQETAKALGRHRPVQLVYCFEKKGVLSDVQNEDSVIASITASDFESLKTSGVVSEGMIPKLQNAFEAIDGGVKKVGIGQAEELPQLLSGKAGTWIQ